MIREAIGAPSSTSPNTEIPRHRACRLSPVSRGPAGTRCLRRRARRRRPRCQTRSCCACSVSVERTQLTRRAGTPSPTSRSGASSLRSAPSDSPFASTKEAQPEEDPSVSARLQRLQNNYEDFGMRRTVEGILVVHDHGHPHILMLQIANAFFKL
jgi:hypothetical protein